MNAVAVVLASGVEGLEFGGGGPMVGGRTRVVSCRLVGSELKTR